MADANTTRYGYVKPEVGASADTWGGKLNQVFDDLDAIGGAIITTGSGAAYVLTTGLSLAAYVAGQSFLINPSFTCNAAATVNVDGLGAKNITKNGTTATVSGDVVSGRIIRITYDGTQFQMAEAAGAGAQPLDATLTALAALSWSSGKPVIQFTAADTVSLTLTPELTDLTLSGVLKASAGSVTSCALQGAADPNTGFLWNGSDVIGIVNNGTEFWRIGATGGITAQSGTATNGLIRGATGAVGTPSFSHRADTNTGAFFDGSDGYFIACGGALSFSYGTTVNISNVPLQAQVADSAETGGTLTGAACRNKRVVCASAPTLPASGMTAGDFILIDPAGTARAVARPAAHTMYVNDVDSATGTSYAHNVALAVYHGSSKWTLHGLP